MEEVYFWWCTPSIVLAFSFDCTDAPLRLYWRAPSIQLNCRALGGDTAKARRKHSEGSLSNQRAFAMSPPSPRHFSKIKEMIQFNQKKTSPKAKESISKSKYERKSVFISKKWKYEVKMRVFIIFYKLTWISLSMLQYFEIYCYTDCLPIRTWWQGLGVLPFAHYLRLEMPSLAFLYRHNPFSSWNSRHHRISFRIRWQLCLPFL